MPAFYPHDLIGEKPLRLAEKVRVVLRPLDGPDPEGRGPGNGEVICCNDQLVLVEKLFPDDLSVADLINTDLGYSLRAYAFYRKVELEFKGEDMTLDQRRRSFPAIRPMRRSECRSRQRRRSLDTGEHSC